MKFPKRGTRKLVPKNKKAGVERTRGTTAKVAKTEITQSSIEKAESVGAKIRSHYGF